MAALGYMAHDDPAPPLARTWSQRISDCGYPYGGRGENIAYGQGSPQSVMDAWLGSAGHRANIESSFYRAIGIGAVRSAAGIMFWAQDFGSTVESGGSPPPPIKPPACQPPVPGAAGSGSWWPVPVPKFYWQWERYRLGLRADRPPEAPRLIRPWAWARLRATLAYRRCRG
jgi:cysteine-rich secretory family protein